MNTLFKLMLLVAISFAFITEGKAQQIANLEAINFQAVALDTDGQEIVGKDVVGKPLYKKDIGVRFTITAGEDGEIYYQETHSTTSNENGLFSLNIGLGEQTDETDYTALLDMPWINGDQWLKVEIALDDNGDFEEASNQKFMAVPYTYYADDIADDAILTQKILDFEILNQDISTGAVDSRVILDSTILNIDFSNESVDTRVILDSTILNEDLSTASVDTRVILDSTLLNEDFNTASVDTRVILDSTILNEDFNTESNDTRVIEDSTIVNEDIATASVDSRVIEDSTLLNEDISTGAVDTRAIEDATILNEDLSNSSVDTRAIEDGTILNEDISNGTIDLTTKVNGILPVENGGTGRNEITAERVLIGNGTAPIKTPPYALDSGQVLTHIEGVTEPYKMEAGTFLTLTYNDGDKTITVTAEAQTLDEGPGTGSFSLGGCIGSGETRTQQFVANPDGDDFIVGDVLLVGAITDIQGLTLTGFVSDTNKVTVVFYNGTNNCIGFGPGATDYTLVNLGQ